MLPGEHNWSVPPTTPTITPKSVTVKAGQNTSVNISTSCDGSSEQCRPVPVTVNLSAQYNNLGTTPGSGGGFKVVGSASVSSASTTDISVSVSGSVVYVSTTPGSNMNGTQQFSGTLRIPAGQKMSSLVTLKEISNANAGQIMATAKATPENCVSGVTVNFELAQESASTSSCNFLYRVFSTGTSYNGFAGQVIYSLSCSGKGRFSSGNTIKVNLPCKSDVVSIDLSGKTGDEIGSTGKLQTALYENCLPQSCMYSVNTCATVNVKGKESTWVKVSSTETGLN